MAICRRGNNRDKSRRKQWGQVPWSVFLTMEPDPVVFHCDFFGPRGFLSESKTSEPDPVVFPLNLCEPMVFHLKPSFHGFSSSNNLFSHIINSNID